MNSLSLPTRANADVIDAAYAAWLQDPQSVDATWNAFFHGFSLAAGATPSAAGKAGSASAGSAPGLASADDALKQSQVDSLIYHYRSIGHVDAHLDPLSAPPEPSPRLALKEFGLREADLDRSFDAGHYLNGGRITLRELVSSLRQTYCGRIGV